MTNATNYGIWNHKNLFYNPSPTYRVLLQKYQNDHPVNSQQTECVNSEIMREILEGKILFWTFVSTWKLMKLEIRFDKRGPTNDVGADRDWQQSFFNHLLNISPLSEITQSAAQCNKDSLEPELVRPELI